MEGNTNKPTVYRIKVRGRLAARWSDWLGGMTIALQTADDGASEAVLTGPVADQSALRGILNGLWDLNLTVIAVNRVDTDFVLRGGGT
jgi:hypothetical protein